MPPAAPRTPEVRRAVPSDLPTMAATLGAAFLDDPVTGYMLRGRQDAARIGYLQTAMAGKFLPQDLSTITPGGEAVAVWAAPKRFRVHVREFLPQMPRILWYLGPGGLWRMARMAEVEKLHPREPHYYLAMLGTHPDHQGRGLGSAAMAPTLARADAEGVACYLESSKESNVPFYRRHGFEVTGTHDIDGGNGPRLWLMWREPQPPGTR